MSVRLSDDEAWEMLTSAHTGILTTLRRDGRPVALPVWHVVLDRRIYVSTRGKKVHRAQQDPRCSFLVEEGERWSELRAVHVECTAAVLDSDDERHAAIAEAVVSKYASFLTSPSAMPAATQRHYGTTTSAVIELSVSGKLLSWDNRRLGITT